MRAAEVLPFRIGAPLGRSFCSASLEAELIRVAHFFFVHELSDFSWFSKNHLFSLYSVINNEKKWFLTIFERSLNSYHVRKKNASGLCCNHIILYTVFATRYTISSPPQTRFRSFHATVTWMSSVEESIANTLYSRVSVGNWRPLSSFAWFA